MSFAIDFAVQGAPVAQPRPKVTTAGGVGQAYVPAKHPVHAWREQIQAASLAEYGGDLRTETLRVELWFVTPRPASLTRKRSDNPRVYRAVKPDIDNYAKAVLDALTGVLWRDDSQVVDLRCHKITAAGGEGPHLSVKVRPASAVTAGGTQTPKN